MKWILWTSRLLLAVSLALAAAGRPAQAQTNGPVYIVQPGDTLFAIARQFGLTLAALQAANPTVNADRLQIGQALVIPGFDAVAGTLSLHFLEAGESLESLALRFGLQRATLVRLNRLINPDQLYINQPLVVLDQADGGAPLAAGLTQTLRPGDSLLALAAAAGQNPWALAAANRRETPGAPPPGALMVVPGGEAAIKALPWPLQDIQLRPTPAEQGGTLVIQVRLAEAAQVSGALGDWALSFHADPAEPLTQYALLGVYRLAEPNLYPLSLRARGASGEARFSQAFPVRQGQYATDPPLTVDPATLDPAAVQPEFERVQAVVTQVSPERLWSGPFLLPSVGAIRSRFGSLRSYNGGPYDSFHGGVDFSGAEDRPITAPAAGVVVLAEPLTVRGNATIIDHGWGVLTGYWHQSSILVTVGQRVQPGEVIGYQGATGRVTGPHLHWEVWVGGFQVEPLAWTETAFP